MKKFTEQDKIIMRTYTLEHNSQRHKEMLVSLISLGVGTGETFLPKANEFQPRNYQGNEFQPRTYWGIEFQPKHEQSSEFRPRNEHSNEFQPKNEQHNEFQPVNYQQSLNQQSHAVADKKDRNRKVKCDFCSKEISYSNLAKHRKLHN